MRIERLAVIVCLLLALITVVAGAYTLREHGQGPVIDGNP